jgi:hypothetical protein
MQKSGMPHPMQEQRLSIRRCAQVFNVIGVPLPVHPEGVLPTLPNLPEPFGRRPGPVTENNIGITCRASFAFFLLEPV